MISIYHKMNWYMRWMLAEHWDSAFRTKALTCPAPGASGCYCLTALSCSGHWAQPKGISDLVQSKPAHQEPPTSKEEMMQECRARLLCLTWEQFWRVIPASQRPPSFSELSVGTELQSSFCLVLLPSLPHKCCSWESSEASHVQPFASEPVPQAM